MVVFILIMNFRNIIIRLFLQASLVCILSYTYALSPVGINVVSDEPQRELENYYDFISRERSTLEQKTKQVNISLLLGNPNLETFIRYASYWKSLPVKPYIVISGGIGRGTAGLIEKVKRTYKNLPSFSDLYSRIDSLSEAEIISEILILEGVTSDHIKALEKNSTNTAENFSLSLPLLKKLAEELKLPSPHLEIITHAPLVYRVHRTALQKLDSLLAEQWALTSRSPVKTRFSDLDRDEKIQSLGYSLGYPASYQPESILNRSSELERIDLYGREKLLKGQNPDLKPVEWESESISSKKAAALRESLFSSFLENPPSEPQHTDEQLLSFYLESGSLSKAEDFLKKRIGDNSPLNSFILTRLISELYFSPHLFSTAEIMNRYKLSLDDLKAYYRVIRNDTLIQNLFFSFSQHSNYFMIIKRELTKATIEDLIHGNFIFPGKMELHVGHRCPANCSFCYSHKMRSDLAAQRNRPAQSMPMYREELNGEEPLSLDEYKNIISDFRKNSKESSPILVISGGAEPASFPHLGDLIEYSHSLGIRVELYTSGIGLGKGKNREEEFKKLLKCSFIRFSLNSATPSTYKKQMNVNGFDLVMKNIRELVRLKHETQSPVSLRANFVITKDNYFEIIPYAHLASELGLDQVVLRTPYTGTTSPLSLEEEQSVTASLLQLKKNAAMKKYGPMEIQMPGNFIFEGYNPRDFGIEKFDWRTAFFSPTLTPFGHLVPRCTVANPGYYSDTYSIGKIDGEAGKDLITTLYRFYKSHYDFKDNMDLYDSSTLSLELFLRYLDRESAIGLSASELPIAPKNGPKFMPQKDTALIQPHQTPVQFSA